MTLPRPDAARRAAARRRIRATATTRRDKVASDLTTVRAELAGVEAHLDHLRALEAGHATELAELDAALTDDPAEA